MSSVFLFLMLDSDGLSSFSLFLLIKWNWKSDNQFALWPVSFFTGINFKLLCWIKGKLICKSLQLLRNFLFLCYKELWLPRNLYLSESIRQLLSISCFGFLFLWLCKWRRSTLRIQFEWNCFHVSESNYCVFPWIINSKIKRNQWKLFFSLLYEYFCLMFFPSILTKLFLTGINDFIWTIIIDEYLIEQLKCGYFENSVPIFITNPIHGKFPSGINLIKLKLHSLIKIWWESKSVCS